MIGAAAGSALLLAAARAVASEAGNNAPLLSTDIVQIFANGSYRVGVPGSAGATELFTAWLSSAPTTLISDGDWKTPAVTAVTGPSAGSDMLGSFKRVDYSWSGVAWTSSIRVYDSFLVFQQNFTSSFDHRAHLAILGESKKLPGKDKPQTHWPAFSNPLPDSAPPLGYLGFSGCMSGRVETGTFPSPDAPPPPPPHQPPATGPAWAGTNAGPLGLFDAKGNTMVLSPLGPEVMSSIMNHAPGVAVAAGLGGAVQSAPAGHAPEFVLVAGKGVRDTWEAWGDVMLARNGKKRTSRDHDVFISHLGYSTTCYYFYNQCDCGYHWPRQCLATDASGRKNAADNTPPPILKGCKNYEDTLIAVHKSHKRQNLPVKYFLIDSWWYGEREHGGTWLWEDTPECVGDTFPGNSSFPGMQRVSAELGGLPFKAHAGTWSAGRGNDTKNPYYSKPEYKFVVEGSSAVPQGSTLWDHVFSKNQESFNLRAIKQDHMCEEIDMPAMTTTVNVARDWLAGMGQGAENQNFSIQYCMTVPLITMNSASIKPATHQRLGADYLAGENHGQWNIGSQAIFIHAVGLMPFKDTFLSNASQAPPTHSNTGKGNGGYQDFKEEAPGLHAASSLLSCGPVSPSDGVDGENVGLIMSLCNTDGLLLKPDKPARAIDAQWTSILPNAPKAPPGTLWSTHATLGNFTWGYVLVAETIANWTAGASVLGLPGTTSGVTWTRPKSQPNGVDSTALVTEVFDASHPLEIPATMPGHFHSSIVDTVSVADPKPYGEEIWELLYTAPTLPNGMILLGEVNKMVPVSTVRFVNIDANASDSTKVDVVGAPTEVVKAAFLIKAGSVAKTASCTVSSDGKCSMTLK